MITNLAKQKCVPCEGGVPPLSESQAEVLLSEVPGWWLSEDAKTIVKKCTFKNFKETLAFINKVGELAEAENHHPDLHLTNYKNLRIDLTTHAISGLSKNDFILAAKINTLSI